MDKYDIFYDGEIVEENRTRKQVEEYLADLKREYFLDGQQAQEQYGDPEPTDEAFHEYVQDVISVKVDVPVGDFY